MSEFENKILSENNNNITEKDSVFNKVKKSQDILKGDLGFDIPKFEETMTLLLKKYELSKKVAEPVAKKIARVRYLEKLKIELPEDMTYKAANNNIPYNLQEYFKEKKAS